MYGIPLNLDLKDIIGSEIEQICLGRYDVQFRFRSGRSINVQGDIELRKGEAVIAIWNEQDNWSSGTFQKLLNTKVLAYVVPHERLLRVEFEGDYSLCLYDSSDQHESMQLYPEGIVI